MAPAAALAVAERMPEVNRSILFDMGHGELRLSYRRKFAHKLESAGYNQAIVLPNSAKSALVPFFAGIKKRTGFIGEMRYFLLNDVRKLDKERLPRMIDRFLSLGSLNDSERSHPIEYPELRVDHENQAQCLSRFGLDIARPVLSLCPGAEFGDAKKWPESHYANVANFAIEAGMQVWIFGSPRDEEVALSIYNNLERQDYGHNLAGKTTLLDVVDLLSLSKLVASNDSGLMHVAAAVGCETAVLYGSSSPIFTPPLTEKLTILTEGLDCSPCFKRDCPLGHKDCLNKLGPEKLYPIVDKVLGRIQ